MGFPESTTSQPNKNGTSNHGSITIEFISCPSRLISWSHRFTRRSNHRTWDECMEHWCCSVINLILLTLLIIFFLSFVFNPFDFHYFTEFDSPFNSCWSFVFIECLFECSWESWGDSSQYLHSFSISNHQQYKWKWEQYHCHQ